MINSSWPAPAVIKNTCFNSKYFLVGLAGLALASNLAVARFGLGTASRFRLLTEHRSGVLVPTQAKQLACSSSNKKYLLYQQVFFGRAGGTRTHDLFVPNEARYQLRYSPLLTTGLPLARTSYGRPRCRQAVVRLWPS